MLSVPNNDIVPQCCYLQKISKEGASAELPKKFRRLKDTCLFKLNVEHLHRRICGSFITDEEERTLTKILWRKGGTEGVESRRCSPGSVCTSAVAALA